MVTPLTWTSYLDTIARLAVVAVDDENFVALAPQMVNYAELRIMRDLDLIGTVTPVDGFSLIANRPTLTLPIATFITIQEINVITPVGTSDPNAGMRHPLVPTSKEYLNTVHNSSAGASLPRVFAVINETLVAFGPWPDQNYAAVITGTVRPASISDANRNTFIATYLPDLFILASMVWISGYQRNFGRQSDDPQQSVSYESQYMTMLKGAMVEEARKKFQASAWSSLSPPLVASPGRNAQQAPG
jgi:hypothetical protein